MKRRPHPPDPLAALRAHEARIKEAQQAVSDLHAFAQVNAVTTLRALQLSATIQQKLAPEEAMEVYDRTARAYLTQLAGEVDRISRQIAAAAGEPEPAVASTPAFHFFTQ